VEILKPLPLKPNDTIGIIAPAGVIKDYEGLTRAVDLLEKKGYRVKLSDNLKKKKWYLAGEDNERLADLMSFFKDPDIKAIFTARGGYGCMRLLESIDYEIIKQNPKILMGYSDITAFHLALQKLTGLVTFHGPLFISDLGKPLPVNFTIENMWSVLEDKPVLPFTIQNYYEPVCIYPGKVNGKIIGGNLSLICALRHTKYAPELHHKILFIEDIGENLYKLDRYFFQLKLSGILKEVKGIIFGDFTDTPGSSDPDVDKLKVIDIIRDVMKDQKLPAMYGFSCGHADFKSTIPLSAEVELDTESGTLKILENWFLTE
jgi:muramoyltetrapeptide carboxypeptidase